MLVWYAAYGSNLLRSRFVTYLQGGPVPGSGRIQAGSRDPSPPLDARSYSLDHPLIFAGRARGWGGGGVCFVDSERSAPDVTSGRAWLITEQQLSDVWAQENGAKVGAGPEVDVEAVVAAGAIDVGNGWYRRLLVVGSLEGYPVVTFTCAEAPESNAAHPSYAQVVGRGLIESWGWSAEQAATYLAACPGNAGSLEAASLVPLLETDPITG